MTKRIKLACPICRKPVSVEEPQFPFCSERCRTIDLGSWAEGKYVVSTPLTAADLLGDADYTMGPVERMPASSVRSVKNEQQIPDARQPEGVDKTNPHAPKARCGAPSGEHKPGTRKEPHGRKRG